MGMIARERFVKTLLLVSNLSPVINSSSLLLMKTKDL